jgi:hypothetical protein
VSSQIRTAIISLLSSTATCKDLAECLSTVTPAENFPSESVSQRLDRIVGMIESFATVNTDGDIPTRSFHSRVGNTVTATATAHVKVDENGSFRVSVAQNNPAPKAAAPTKAAAGAKAIAAPKSISEAAEIWNEWPSDFRSLGIMTLADSAKEVGVDISDLGRQKQAIFDRVYAAREAAGLPVPERPAAIAQETEESEFDFRKLDLAELRRELETLGENPKPYGAQKRALYARIQELKGAAPSVNASANASEIESENNLDSNAYKADEYRVDGYGDEYDNSGDDGDDSFDVANEYDEAESAINSDNEPLLEDLLITPAPQQASPFVTRMVIGGAQVGATRNDLMEAVKSAKEIDIDKLMAE